MKEDCKRALRSFIMEQFSKARCEAHCTQAKFAEILMIDTRAYVAIENGEYGCGALTLMLFLIFCCTDVVAFVEESRIVILGILGLDADGVF